MGEQIATEGKGIMMKLCLGTVQQGMAYGINNQYGKPSKETSLQIFHAAVKNGITTFDTAQAYGDAEVLLGDYLKEYGNREEIKIISKLQPNCLDSQTNFYDVMRRECEGSLQRIGIQQLDGYLFHTPGYIRDPAAVWALKRLKEEKLVKNIGVSIYEIEDGDFAIQTGVVDYIQLPFSVFDQRGLTSGFLKRAKEAGITTFTRSMFLQGLYFMNEASLPDKVEQAKPMLEKFNHLLEIYQLNREDVLIQFVKMCDGIDYIVLGVDTIEQLAQDISIFRKNDCLPKEAYEHIRAEFREISNSVIIPSLWAKPIKHKHNNIGLSGTKILETERLLLRPFVEQDAENVYRNFGSSEDVYRFLPCNQHQNLAETKKIVHQWVEKYREDGRYYWCIDLKPEKQKAIGAVYLVNENKEDHSLELGFCLGKKWWNQGIITQAAQMVCEYIQQLGKFDYVWGRHDQLNPASGKVFLYTGFQFEKSEDMDLKGKQTKTIMFYKKDLR